MVGAAICRALSRSGYRRVTPLSGRQLDFFDPKAVSDYFFKHQPDYVFCFAGPHGGIGANIRYPADFAHQNLTLQCNLLHSAYQAGVKRLLFLSGSCVYPRDCPQPMREEYFQSGPMEPTSVAYSMARCAGIELCLAYNRQYRTCFIPAIFSNYYGIQDDYSDNGHALAGMMQKIHAAKQNNQPELVLWGTGAPLRQFLYIDDLADGAVCIMSRLREPQLINIAGGEEKSIAEAAHELCDVVGYRGGIIFDASRPDGAMRKSMDNSKLRALGWRERVGWSEGLRLAYRWFCEHAAPGLELQ